MMFAPLLDKVRPATSRNHAEAERNFIGSTGLVVTKRIALSTGRKEMASWSERSSKDPWRFRDAHVSYCSNMADVVDVAALLWYGDGWVRCQCTFMFLPEL